jgi:hypothetical protein
MVKSAAPGIVSIALHLRDNELIEAKERIIHPIFTTKTEKLSGDTDGKRSDGRNQLRCTHRNLRNTNSVENLNLSFMPFHSSMSVLSIGFLRTFVPVRIVIN